MPKKISVPPGTIYQRLTVLNETEPHQMPCGHYERMFLCRCECGKELPVRLVSLRCGNTKSCGCLKAERAEKMKLSHGHARAGKISPTYYSYAGMIDRCERKSHRYYANYGGRGITVCPEWRASFAQFLKDMGERPEGKTLDRIDNDKGYFPGNVRWATAIEQRSNQRKS